MVPPSDVLNDKTDLIIKMSSLSFGATDESWRDRCLRNYIMKTLLHTVLYLVLY